MKIGTKLRRIKRGAVSCEVYRGKVYTFDGMKEGYFRIKERKRLGYSWHLDFFEVVEEK